MLLLRWIPLLLLPSATVATSSSLAPWPSDMEVRPNEGEMVHTTGVMEAIEGDPWNSETTPMVLYVESDIPVVAERMTIGSSAFLEPPIPFGNAMVIIKSSGCPEGSSIDFTIQNSTLQNGRDYLLKITTQSDTETSISNFLDSSAIFRQLKCFSQVGPPCEPPVLEESNGGEKSPAPEESNGGETSPAPSPVGEEPATSGTTKASLLLSIFVVGLSTLFSSTRSSRGSLIFLAASGLLGATILLLSPSAAPVQATTRELQEQCTVQVEVVYWGCATVLNVKAPNMVLRNMQQEATEDRENCNCTSLATFPDLDAPRDGEEWVYWDSDANNTITTDGATQQVPTADSGNCYIAIGRPFKDREGTSIQSTPSLVEQEQATWSREDRALLQQYNSAPPTEAIVTSIDAVQNDWIHRALGEHASVASFAAFAIALMTNGAPPELVQGALRAAQDELRHAQVSFLVASRLQNTAAVEPKALPESSHAFGADLMTLAQGVIEEGCIDETLSALQMAADFDDSNNSEAEEWMWNITRIIALEEGQHSVLAWRTIRWICQKDSTICNQLTSEYLNSDRLLAVALGKHDANSAVYSAWKCLAPRMACHVTKGGLDCLQQDFCTGMDKGALVTELVHQIDQGAAQGVAGVAQTPLRVT